jgi:threonine synthase
VHLVRHPRWTNVLVAAEYLLPTGSFKIRGAEAVVADAAARGAVRVSLDSSGNAGLAVAVLAKSAGLRAIVRVSGIREEKKGLLIDAGATVEEFPTRAEAAAACLEDTASYDASHVRNPLFRRGIASFWENWPAGYRIPEEIVLPAGNGTLLIGLAEGFPAGQSRNSLPRLIAVQAEHCAPLARPEDPGDGVTAADGCAVRSPPLADEVRGLVARSRGEFRTISEHGIEVATERAWKDGFPIEPTSGLAFAAAESRSETGGPILLMATGAAWKGGC